MVWSIDRAHSHIGFSAKHMMLSTVRGHFRDFRGKVTFDPVHFLNSSFEGEVDVESIDTGVEPRDEHLRTSDFLDAAHHPKISFKSSSIEQTSESAYVVRGDLTIRGVKRPIALDVEFHGVARNPWGKTVSGLSATTTISRKDFGLNYNALLETGGVAIGEKVNVELEAEFVAEDVDA